MKKPNPLLFFALLIALLPACRDKPSTPAAGVPVAGDTPVAPRGVPVTHKWLGQWTGPEGTYLTLEARGDGYLITVRLGDLATYEGKPARASVSIKFQRGGQLESIRHGSGKDTGVPALAGKSDCLYIKEGEGFCRD